jgi:hypothetical protein
VPLRSLAPLLAACCAAVALVGCGEAAVGKTGSVSVAVTRDFGVTPVVSSPPVGMRGTTALLSVIDRVTDTREGTRTITSVNGTDGDWRLFVNGVRVKNAGKATVKPGDRVWLDLPPAGTPTVPAVTGAFPEPFLHGIGGKRIPTRVECSATGSKACDDVATRLGALGVVAARGGINAGSNDLTIRVLVGTWTSLRATMDEAVGRVDAGPARSGVFARFDRTGRTLDVLDETGKATGHLGADTGMVAATKIGAREPVWFVAGTTEAGVEAAAGALDEATLTTGYGLAIHDGRGVRLPAR